ncbi:GGDEF domain-containing protein [Caldimonas sp. KR1-144]|uniref:GGDEF domain-containing protein n=1 Tax=Caldimonas sp. KR1-144 TaxID=3400911 RepID=UPI003BFA98D9
MAPPTSALAALPAYHGDASVYAPLASRSVLQLIEQRALRIHFQPIVELAGGAVFGHEALVRPPAGCLWPTPDQLFAAAREQQVSHRLEAECVHEAFAAWDRHATPGKLFVNLSAGALIDVLQTQDFRDLVWAATGSGVAAASLVIELTEHEHVRDTQALLAAVQPLREQGVALALDDFGDGRSSLRLWSELKPELVKIDKFFTRDLARKGEKLQTWRALLQIAETFGTRIVAEGIESDDELRLLRDLGVPLGQGFALGRPALQPVDEPLPAARRVLESPDIAVFPQQRRASNRGITAARLRIPAPTVAPQTPHDEVFELLRLHESLHAVAIVDADQRVKGLLNRQAFVAHYAKPYFRELYGRKPCTTFANLSPLLIDVHTGIEELTTVLTSSDQRYLTEGFVLIEGGRYRGLGTGESLVRAVTEARIEAARHANPLTFLPGNIPITDHIERLLESGRDFVAAYADLNHFKPFNDHYGYWRGDEMIRLVARALVAHCDARRDFVGHVGGDDFVVLFQSDDWLERCERIVAAFNAAARELFDAEALAAGGIWAEDRHGVPRFHPVTTLTIGAVPVAPQRYRQAADVANAAAWAKRHAKHANRGVLVRNDEAPVPAEAPR